MARAAPEAMAFRAQPTRGPHEALAAMSEAPATVGARRPLKTLLAVALVVAVATVVTSLRTRTSFSVRASTEILELKTAPQHRSSWTLEAAQVFLGYSDQRRPFTGTLR